MLTRSSCPPGNGPSPDFAAGAPPELRRNGPALGRADLTPYELGRIGRRGNRETWDGKEVMLRVAWWGYEDLVPPDRKRRIFLRGTRPLAEDDDPTT
jgi:hypothetical protein